MKILGYVVKSTYTENCIYAGDSYIMKRGGRIDFCFKDGSDNVVKYLGEMYSLKGAKIAASRYLQSDSGCIQKFDVVPVDENRVVQLGNVVASYVHC